MQKLAKSFITSWVGEEGEAKEGNLLGIREPLDNLQIFVDYIKGDSQFVLTACENQIESFLRQSADERDFYDSQSIFLLYGYALKELDREDDAVQFWEKSVNQYITNPRHKQKILKVLEQSK